MVHAPYHLSLRGGGGVCICEGSLKQYYTRRLILSECWRPVLTHECVDYMHSKSADLLITHWPLSEVWTTLTGGTWVQSTHAHTLPSLPCVIKSLPALPSVRSERILQAHSVPLWARDDDLGSWGWHLWLSGCLLFTLWHPWDQRSVCIVCQFGKKKNNIVLQGTGSRCRPLLHLCF